MPRPSTANTGLRGPGQEIFTDEAKEYGRDLGLDTTATILRNEPKDDGGGAQKDHWEPIAENVPARIDIFGRLSQAKGEAADRIDEHTSHIVSFPQGTDCTTKDRLEINGQLWSVLAVQERTGTATFRVEVKGI
jgi:hypothetical protein